MATALRDRALSIGADPGDTADERFRKRLLVGVALVILPVAFVWGCLYWVIGEHGVALTPWGYATGSAISLAVFARTRRLAFLRTAQQLLILVAPALGMIMLGGLDESSSVILWSLFAPLGAVAAPPADGGTPRGNPGAAQRAGHGVPRQQVRSAQDVPQDQLRIAARSVPWLTQAVLASPEDTGFGLRTTIPRRAVIGVLEEALPPGSIHGRLDRGTRMTVRLFDGELESVSRIQMLNGANAAAIRSAAGIWEILQFEEAEEIAASVWRLSGILRGQLGTNDAMAAGTETGAPFVLLDEAAAPAGLTADEIGLALNWRVGPVGYDISDENFLATSTAGGTRALMPLSPVHLKVRMENDDLHLSWIRRGRHELPAGHRPSPRPAPAPP
jgi:hypothetical protein